MDAVQAIYLNGTIFTENSQQAQDLFKKSSFGTLKNGRVELSIIEATYLLDKKRIKLIDGRSKPITFEQLSKKVAKEKNFWTRYAVFRDFRDRGYVIKTALKFGADFRVYQRGSKPGEKHAKWIVYPVKESQTMTWQEFSAKNRVAHSTKKKLLLGVVDDEGDVSYWEVSWVKP